MKKIFTLLIVFSFLFIIPVGTGYAVTHNEQDISILLNKLNIMRGDGDGNLRLDDSVTRAEFIKVAIAGSSYRNSVAQNLTISPFKDVKHDHWAAPYIKLAVTNKIVSGYPDGTFAPDNTVLYEEAISIYLKLLGYTDSDFGVSWPYGQVALGENLDLNKNVTARTGSYMTRRDVMLLTYNLLSVKPKNTQTLYIEQISYKIIDDVTLIATPLQDSQVGSDKLVASSGTYKIDSAFDQNLIGKKGSIIVKNGDEFVWFIPNEQQIKQYNIYQILDNKVIVLEDNQLITLDIDTNLNVYNKSAKNTLKNSLTTISAGDSLTIYYDKNGTIDYGFVVTDSLSLPYTVKNNGWVSELGLDGANVTRDGVKVSIEDIKVNDVIYYSKPLNIVWAYSKKITGIYEKAAPNKDTLTSVTISGVEYKIEGDKAFNKLSSNGNFQFGDTITVLIGKNGAIVDVLDVANAGVAGIGYVIETGKKSFVNSNDETYGSNYIKMVQGDGVIGEYSVSRDYETMKNKLAKIDFKNGTLSVVNTKASELTGTITDLKIGKYTIPKSTKIIDVLTIDPNENGNYAVVYPQRINGVELREQDVLYYEKDAQGQISTLFLKNVTGECYQYGLMTSVNTSKKVTDWVTETDKEGNTTTKTQSTGLGTASYTYDVNGTVSSFSSSTTLYPVSSGQAVSISVINGRLDKITALKKLTKAITKVSETEVETASGNYLLSDKVTVYLRENSSEYKFLKIPISDIKDSKSYKLEAYYDKEQSFGGRIRIIVALKNK